MKLTSTNTNSTFCDLHCKGKYYHPNNAKRQQQVRAILPKNVTKLPNHCAGSLTSKCMCPYAK